MDEPRDTRAQQASNILNSAAEMASNSAAKMSDAAQAAGQKAKDTASALAGQAGEHVKGVLNDQVNVGADLVGHVADSVRAAADTLEQNSPQLASMARLAASGIDGFSDRLRDRTVEDLYQEASDFARRQPAAVFGMAALAGFFFFRVVKADGRSNGYGEGGYGEGYRGPQGGYPGAQRDYSGTQGGYAGVQGGYAPTDERRHGV